MKKCHAIFAASTIAIACVSTAFAATPIDLKSVSPAVFSLYVNPSIANPNSNIVVKSQNVDRNGTSHTRIQQQYLGYPVWAADGVVHTPKNGAKGLTHLNALSSMNGTFYSAIDTDLAKTPAFVFEAAQANAALQNATTLYTKKTGINRFDLNHARKDLMVYVGKDNQAHWAYYVSFIAAATNTLSQPTFIMDAQNFGVYEQWDNAQNLEDVDGGGFGGNTKTGKLSYDGLSSHLPKLTMQRDDAKKICYIQNDDVVVMDMKRSQGPFSDAPVAEFKCAATDKAHGDVYWDANLGAVNGGYSPANDALYIGAIIKGMYAEWYQLPVLGTKDEPMQLKMNVHATDLFGQPMDNAMFLSLNNEMYYGDGVKMFYPLTSLGVGAHEISHGFTFQHANLVYQHQSGGLNESFSDMAAQAAEFYSTGKNTWQIGPEIVKGKGALRYLDEPTKDGHSIDNVKNYTDELNVHYTSGVFNKFFYLLSTATDWNTKKAFDAMVTANMNYWTTNSTFAQAACGVAHAARDLKYEPEGVAVAAKGVGLDLSNC